MSSRRQRKYNNLYPWSRPFYRSIKTRAHTLAHRAEERQNILLGDVLNKPRQGGQRWPARRGCLFTFSFFSVAASFLSPWRWQLCTCNDTLHEMNFLNYDAKKIISKQLLFTSGAIGHLHNEKQCIISQLVIVSLRFSLSSLSLSICRHCSDIQFHLWEAGNKFVFTWAIRQLFGACFPVDSCDFFFSITVLSHPCSKKA